MVIKKGAGKSGRSLFDRPHGVLWSQKNHQPLFQQEENMGYIFAYLLFVLVVDLILEIVRPERGRQLPVASHRRLWNDSLCDCRSMVFSVDAARATSRQLTASGNRPDRIR